MNVGFPFEALAEGVALVRGDGVLQPLNQPMQRWLQVSLPNGATARLDALVPEPERRARLERGEAVPVAGCDEPAELLLRTAEGQVWLLVRPTATAFEVQLATARARALARLAGSLSHDLANMLGAAIGVAETLRDHVAEERDRRTLAELVAGVRRGSELAMALERQLRARGRLRPTASVGRALDELRLLFGKAAQHRAFELQCVRDDDLPTVRIDQVVLVQLLLHALFLGVQTQATSAQLQARAAELRIAGGRPRAGVRVLCDLAGGEAAATRAAAAAFGEAEDLLRPAPDEPEAVRDLLLARFAVLRAGGAMQMQEQGASLQLVVDLPAASDA